MESNSIQQQVDDLETTIQQAQDVLEEAYTPEATRADLVEAVSQALDILSGEEADEEDEDEGEE